MLQCGMIADAVLSYLRFCCI